MVDLKTKERFLCLSLGLLWSLLICCKNQRNLFNLGLYLFWRLKQVFFRGIIIKNSHLFCCLRLLWGILIYEHLLFFKKLIKKHVGRSNLNFLTACNSENRLMMIDFRTKELIFYISLGFLFNFKQLITKHVVPSNLYFLTA